LSRDIGRVFEEYLRTGWTKVMREGQKNDNRKERVKMYSSHRQCSEHMLVASNCVL